MKRPSGCIRSTRSIDNRCLHVFPGFADAPGYRTIKTIQSGALSQDAPVRGGYASLTWKDLVEGGHIIAGSPETVRQRMEDLIKGLNVGNIFCLLHVGDMPLDKCMYSTRLFAEKVMPKLRDLFPEFADDNRFWCKPLARQAKVGTCPMPPRWRRAWRDKGADHGTEDHTHPPCAGALLTWAARGRRWCTCMPPAA